MKKGLILVLLVLLSFQVFATETKLDKKDILEDFEFSSLYYKILMNNYFDTLTNMVEKDSSLKGIVDKYKVSYNKTLFDYTNKTLKDYGMSITKKDIDKIDKKHLDHLLDHTYTFMKLKDKDKIADDIVKNYTLEQKIYYNFYYTVTLINK